MTDKEKLPLESVEISTLDPEVEGVPEEVVKQVQEGKLTRAVLGRTIVDGEEHRMYTILSRYSLHNIK